LNSFVSIEVSIEFFINIFLVASLKTSVAVLQKNIIEAYWDFDILFIFAFPRRYTGVAFLRGMYSVHPRKPPPWIVDFVQKEKNAHILLYT